MEVVWLKQIFEKELLKKQAERTAGEDPMEMIKLQ
jgi:hypothetical protein